MALYAGMMVLRQAMAETGLHPSDVLMEFRTVTLSSGTVECPTVFENGQIIGVTITDVGTTAVNSTVGFACDLVVSTGAITINSNTGGAQTVFVVIYGRPKV